MDCIAGLVMHSDITVSGGTKTERLIFIWEIPNLLQRWAPPVFSRPFSGGPVAEARWSTTLDINRAIELPEIGLTLELDEFAAPPETRPGVTIESELSVVAPDGTLVLTKTGVRVEHTAEAIVLRDGRQSVELEWEPYVTVKELEDAAALRSDGSLVLQFRLTGSYSFGHAVCAGSSSATNGAAKIAAAEDSIANRLLQDLGDLLQHCQFSDFALVTDGGEAFPVHRLILATRSPVFAAMLQHDTEDSRTGRVHVPDVEAPVMEELLRYIYTGKVSNLAGICQALLAAADKYELKELVRLCEEYMSVNINKENAISVLVLADLHSLEELRCKAVETVVLHGTELIHSPDWEQIRSRPRLNADVMSSVFNNKK